MTSLSLASAFNARATLNATLRASLLAVTLPSLLESCPPVVLNWPLVTSTVPCFAVAHFAGRLEQPWQGQVTGINEAGRRRLAMMEVSCFEKIAHPNVEARLLIMSDMVSDFVIRNSSIRMLDYRTNSAAPAVTGYKIDLHEVEEVTVEPDAALAVKRVRLLIRYSFVTRAS